MTNKVAIFVYESLAGDMSRAYRGLKTALEFVQAGDEVAVVFDGSGVETLAAIAILAASSTEYFRRSSQVLMVHVLFALPHTR